MKPPPLSPAAGNLFAALPPALPNEVIEVLLSTSNLRIERIVSHGQATSPGQWYDQDSAEWVILLTGRARLRLEDQVEAVEMSAGDYLLLAAHQRHRVEWTDPNVDTIWLAVHFVDDTG